MSTSTRSRLTAGGLAGLALVVLSATPAWAPATTDPITRAASAAPSTTRPANGVPTWQGNSPTTAPVSVPPPTTTPATLAPPTTRPSLLAPPTTRPSTVPNLPLPGPGAQTTNPAVPTIPATNPGGGSPDDPATATTTLSVSTTRPKGPTTTVPAIPKNGGAPAVPVSSDTGGSSGLLLAGALAVAIVLSATAVPLVVRRRRSA